MCLAFHSFYETYFNWCVLALNKSTKEKIFIGFARDACGQLPSTLSCLHLDKNSLKV